MSNRSRPSQTPIKRISLTKKWHLSSILVLLFSLYCLCHYSFHRLLPSAKTVTSVPNLPCGDPWSLSRGSFRHVPKRPYDKPLIWTVSGGPEYRAYLKSILKQWQTIGLDPVLVIALDRETSTYVCKDLGYQAVLWDLPKASYSKVADAKFEVAATLAELGIPAFFMEIDVFCKESPLPLFLQTKGRGIVVSGHGYADFVPNIGQYYVEPLEATADFFRSLAKVLVYSKDNGDYVTQKNITLEFFDQRLFYQCLPPTNRHDANYNTTQTMHLRKDPHNNLLAICRNVSHAKPFPWTTVSNVYISAHSPPTVFESTICVHPLSDSPFSSFRLKLATSKFLGFDSEPMRPSEKFLRTLTGDLTFNECWVFPFVGVDLWPQDKSSHKNFLNTFVNLVLFAKLSGRTLVLPRYFRDQNAFAIPILSLIDVRTVEAHVPYKYLPAGTEHTVIVADGNRDHLLQELQSDDRVIAVHRFCEFANVTYPETKEILESLKSCVTDRRVKFVRSIGSWSRLCGQE